MAVYFAQIPSSGLIKIGCSINVSRRIEELEKQYEEPLVLLRVLRGGRRHERKMHGRFVHLRVKVIDRRDTKHWMEWFWPGVDLMAFIRRPIFAAAKPDGQELVVESHSRAWDLGHPVYWELITDRADEAEEGE